ncbi:MULTISPECIES: phage integrase N-terminal SAM-like domain-containing protein [Pseudoalteromonas]|nr:MULTISPECIES: phage integrase N-terminal SAM-like domain-containing protein [Pseudoalteromonas]
MKTKSPFLNNLIDYMYSHHYAKKSIETYVFWTSAYIHFHNKRHPASMGNNEVEIFLNHLTVTKKVAAKTQATALNALAFLYKHINKRHYLIASLLYPCFATRCQWRSEPVFEIIIAEA